MKTIVSIILTAILICSAVFSAAESLTDINIKALDNDTLSSLADEIKAEMASRGLLNEIYPGLYLAGRDIEVGSFVYTNTEMGKDIEKFYIWIYPDMSAWDKKNAEGSNFSSAQQNAICYSTIYSAGDRITINLEKGNVLYIPYGVGTLERIQQAWAP
ncbi:MAG: hypothetical protein QM308_10860 [Bacillota bacterium]|nr:hypothetical protein [Bacillota bacterium]